MSKYTTEYVVDTLRGAGLYVTECSVDDWDSDSWYFPEECLKIQVVYPNRWGLDMDSEDINLYVMGSSLTEAASKAVDYISSIHMSTSRILGLLGDKI